MHTIHLWDRCFILQSPSYLSGRAAGQVPYTRLSITLLVAGGKPLRISLEGAEPQTVQAALVGPRAVRNAIEAIGSDLTILDAGLTTPAYERLESQLASGQHFRALDEPVCAQLQALLRPGFGGLMECGEAQQLFDRAIALVVPQPPARAPLDPRIAAVLQGVAARPLEELSVKDLAASVQLSEPRLRALFQKRYGCSVAHYMRWATAWKVIRGLRQGRSFTEVAHEAGFHDLPHADRVLRELFGANPTELIKTRAVHFRKCDW